MSADEVNTVLNGVLLEFSNRYQDIQGIFLAHYALIAHLLNEEEVNSITTEARLLLGSYFTMEYSIEAAALFNPSIVEDPDQSDTIEGELKVIISFRATGIVKRC